MAGSVEVGRQAAEAQVVASQHMARKAVVNSLQPGVVG